MKQVKLINVEHSNEVLTSFGITLAILQSLFVLAFGIFVRANIHSSTDLLDHERPTVLLSINFMLLLGFGLLLTSVRTNSLTALVYSLLLVAVVLQFYVLIQGFWSQVFTGFQSEFYIYLDEPLLIRACYCVTSSLIAMAAIVGRLNPTELIKVVTLHASTYALNEQIVYRALGAHDAGGGSAVHTFGAYFGLAVSWVLSKAAAPVTRPQKSYQSNLSGLLGTLFLWVFWPFFNSGLQAHNSYERTIILTNTYCSLAASTLGTFIVTAIHGRGLLIQDLQHATVAGGVAIAANCSVLYIPALALGIGLLSGVISTNCVHYLQPRLQKSFKIVDPHSVHSVHGLPGLFGIILSGIILMAYNSTGYDLAVGQLFSSASVFQPTTNFPRAGGFHLLAALSSLLIGLLAGLAAGKFVALFYREEPQNFYEDCTYFDRNLFLSMEDREIRYEEPPQAHQVPVVVEKGRPSPREAEQRPRASYYQRSQEQKIQRRGPSTPAAMSTPRRSRPREK